MLVPGGGGMLSAVITCSVALIGVWLVDGGQNLRTWQVKVLKGV